MPLNSSQLQIYWHELKPRMLKHWKKLSEAELETTHGDLSALKALLKSKYGEGQMIDQDLEGLYRSLLEEAEELDDIDEDGMTSFTGGSADYTGLLYETRNERSPLKEVELPIKPETDETSIIQHPDKKTSPDEINTNQDPFSSQEKDISLGRSNSSANTTSPSALTSSGVIKL